MLEYLNCFYSLANVDVFLSYVAFIVLILPLFVVVLYMGYQRRRHQQSTSTTSHVDVVTYHMVVLEIFGLMGCGCYGIGLYLADDSVIESGIYIFSFVFPGQSLFHCLTCVERYLAVVHPITYLSLRRPDGVRLRNISIGCVWLTCFGWLGFTYLYLPDFPLLPYFVLYTLSLLVCSVCSISVLYTLTHPGPGEGSGHRVDQSKQRAFHTIMAITAPLVFGFCGMIVCMMTFRYLLTRGVVSCVPIRFMFWFSLPSSLVLPLLFLYRAGKLGCFNFAQYFS